MISTNKIISVTNSNEEIREHVAWELAGSLPIPLLNGKHLIAQAFYYARSGFPPKTVFDLYPPTWLACIDWQSGQVISVQEHPPQAFGMEGTRFQVFATHSYRNQNIEAKRAGLGDVTERVAALAHAYDELLPLFIAGEVAKQDVAAKFRTLFASLVEPPYWPVYYRLGAKFFKWVGF